MERVVYHVINLVAIGSIADESSIRVISAGDGM